MPLFSRRDVSKRRLAIGTATILTEPLEVRCLLATNGLNGTYYDNDNFTNPKVTRVDPTVNFDWGAGSPAASIGADTFSVRWTGKIQAPQTGSYTFWVTADNRAELFIDGAKAVNTPVSNSGAANLTAGLHDITLNFIEGTGNAAVKLEWAGPGTGARQVVPTANLFTDDGGGTTQTPFKGSPFAVNQTIEAEDFDNGGEGVAFHDTDPTNQGGKYRADVGVDIETSGDTGGGFNVGYARPGEWLEYTINIGTAGNYDVQTRLAAVQTGKLHYEVDGQTRATVDITPTVGFQAYKAVTNSLGNLAAGPHVLRLAFDSTDGTRGVANVNWLKVVSASGGTNDTQPPSAVPDFKLFRTDTVGVWKYDATWSAATDNVGVAGYRLTYTVHAPIDGDGNYETRQESSTVGPDERSWSYAAQSGTTLKDVKIAAFDAAGNVGTFSSPTNVGDEQAPTTPRIDPQKVFSDEHSITLGWDAASDNVGVKEYRVYRRDGLVATVPGNVTTATDRFNYTLGGELYEYFVVAVDAAGNTSAPGHMDISATRDAWGNGLTGSYYDNPDFTNLKFRRVDQQLDYLWDTGSPDARIGPDTFSVRWTGFIKSFVTGTHLFRAIGDDRMKLTINGQTIVDYDPGHSKPNSVGSIQLNENQLYPIVIEYAEGTGRARATLDWQFAGPSGQPNGTWLRVGQNVLFTDPTIGGGTSDIQEPSAVPGFQARQFYGQTTSVELDWFKATDDFGIKEYRLFKDGQPLATVVPRDYPRGYSYEATGLTPGKTYTFGIRAVDAFGNLGSLKEVPFTVPS